MKHLLLILGSLVILFAGCSKENESYFAKRDRDYYPLESGGYNIYEVTEINIDEPSEVYDTLNYQLKELIGGVYSDDEGLTSYLLMRYKRSDSGKAWSVSDVWSVQYKNYRLFITEENVRYVKMYLPLLQGKTWDGNAYNSLSETEYEITDFDTPLTINGQLFDSCLTVMHEADSSLIHKNLVFEQFARDTGLVYKEITHINSQEIEPGVPLEDRITTGTIYKQTFIERGRDENYYE